MQDSLGGNAKTLMFVNVGPAASNINESVDSLAYGDLVKNITNEKVAEDADNEEQIRFLGAKREFAADRQGPIGPTEGGCSCRRRNQRRLDHRKPTRTHAAAIVAHTSLR